MSASATPAVSRALRDLAWPALRTHGFTTHTSRVAWRVREDTVDVVSVDAAVSKFKTPLYLGDHGDKPAYATLGSFSVRVGTYYAVRRWLPYRRSRYGDPMDLARIPEFYCDERLPLTKSIPTESRLPARPVGRSRRRIERRGHGSRRHGVD